MRITKFSTKSSEVIWEGSVQLKNSPRIETFFNNITLPDEDDYELVFVWTHGSTNWYNYSIYNISTNTIVLSQVTNDNPYKETYNFKTGHYVYNGHPYTNSNELYYDVYDLPKGLDHQTISRDEIVRKIILRRTTNYDNTII